MEWSHNYPSCSMCHQTCTNQFAWPLTQHNGQGLDYFSVWCFKWKEIQGSLFVMVVVSLYFNYVEIGKKNFKNWK